jgi:molybdopterin synthase catalytic subunit
MEIVVNKRITPGDVYELVKKDVAGSIVLHFTVVRSSAENKNVSSIEFEVIGG